MSTLTRIDRSEYATGIGVFPVLLGYQYRVRLFAHPLCGLRESRVISRDSLGLLKKAAESVRYQRILGDAWETWPEEGAYEPRFLTPG